MPALRIAVAGGFVGAVVGAFAAVVVGLRCGEDGWAAGAAEQALTNAAHITVRTAPSAFLIGTIVQPRRGHGDAWFRQGRQTDRREPRNAVPPR
jgi:hypothetical protein